MVAKSIEINNGRKLNLNLLNRGLTVTTVNKQGQTERTICIEDDELVMLIGLYEELQSKDAKTAYILDDFARKILSDSRGDDYIEEFRIIQ